MLNPVIQALDQIGSGVILFWNTLKHLPRFHREWGRFLEQCWFMGVRTAPLVAILSLFIGGVLALQVGFSTNAFAVNEFIGTIVGLSVVRELGPVMTAIMVTGRVGSAVTAELASMKVYQEVDALKTMSIPPERFLVLPRLMAMLLMMPALAISSIVFGWVGGQLMATYVPWLGLTPEQYYYSLRDQVDWKDLTNGLIKAEVFGLLIIMVCCNIGLRTRGGPREIGAAVTKAVVSCIIFILSVDLFVTYVLG